MTIGNPNDADRVEKVRVSQQGSSEYVEHVVQDTAAAQRSFSFQITSLMWLMLGALESLLALRVILKLMPPQLPRSRRRRRRRRARPRRR